ncbi:MAG: hypothetical protein NVS1B13_26040 [Flavisolibacter sp.]
MSDNIHIVCLDRPSPPDYGGAIDMHYKIRALHKMGKKIILHYFKYKVDAQPELLQSYCSQIHTYSRTGGLKALSLKIPYIIKSRINHHLIDRLNQDSYPIILEGIHCAGIIPFLSHKRAIVLRMHNNEASYYRTLCLQKVNIVKKIYYYLESILLENYQKNLPKDIPLACISTSDAEAFTHQYHFKKVVFIPCFIPWQNTLIKDKKGNYCLYHGNMSIAENESAARWLIKNIFSQMKIPLIIAGSGITKGLSKSAAKFSNIQLVPDPCFEELEALIQNAQIHVLPSWNNTGVKLKLLHALLRGRFCITNFRSLLGSAIGIQIPIAIKDSASDYRNYIEEKFFEEFSLSQIGLRETLLSIYNNEAGAKKLIELL